ncbi:MAG: C45 family peptidase [Gammaproteobacteria bacterium]|nr:C45 family peptidase [Gammaproteobacteria bacterium]
MFRQITLAGDPAARGLEHGRLLAAEIQQTVELYLRYFARPEAELVSVAEQYCRVVREYTSDYATEIEAIAEGADLPAWKLYALNARTEIINAATPECTAIYFARNRILGQNWDWLAAMEALCVIATIVRPDGHWIVTLIEPGMLAKIGMNSCGLGVCLNILRQPHNGAGVPVHVVLRAVLDSMNIEQAKQEIIRSGNDKASHLLIGDARGQCYGMELAAQGVHELTPTDGLLVHTNHYLTPGVAEPDPESTTRDRLARAQSLGAAASDQSSDDMRRILLDMSDGERSINSTYRSRDDFAGMDAGTVATVVMDLPNNVMHVSQGNNPQRSFTRLEL